MCVCACVCVCVRGEDVTLCSPRHAKRAQTKDDRATDSAQAAVQRDATRGRWNQLVVNLVQIGHDLFLNAYYHMV